LPTAGKVFKYREELSLEQIRDSLEGYETEVCFEGPEEDLQLIADIVSLSLGESELSGIFRYDQPTTINHRSGITVLPKTVRAFFVFIVEEETVFLLIVAKKTVANNVANELSKILHKEVGAIVEARIDPKSLEGFYSAGEATKVLLFDEILVPNMNKLTLYGDNVLQTDLYGEYSKEGLASYIVTKTREGYTVGVTREASVTIFNEIDTPTFEHFIKQTILPLILGRAWK